MLDFLTFYAAAWFSAWGLVCYAAGLVLGRMWERHSSSQGGTLGADE